MAMLNIHCRQKENEINPYKVSGRSAELFWQELAARLECTLFCVDTIVWFDFDVNIFFGWGRGEGRGTKWREMSEIKLGSRTK
jgi:hypothetical protein